jgi:predicted amidohydrolase
MKRFRLCAVQLETGRSVPDNRERAFNLCRAAAEGKPDFIVLPEMFEIVAAPRKAAQYAADIPSDRTERIAGLARELSTNIIGGTLFEQADGAVYNTSLVFDRNGKLCGTYRKIHLFDAFGYSESESISRGDKPLVLELDGLCFGMAVCYDVRFPELFRHYAVQGVQVVFVPSAFFQPNHDHWQLSLRARAIDNGIFVLGCNQTGKRFVGRSMVVDPWGIAVASLGVEEGVLTVDVDCERVASTRQKLPLLANRRFDVSLRDEGALQE